MLLLGSINLDYCGPRGLLEGNGLMHMTARLSRSAISTTFLGILVLCLFFSFFSQLIVLFSGLLHHNYFMSWQVCNPSTGKVIADVSCMGGRETNDAISSAYDAFYCMEL